MSEAIAVLIAVWSSSIWQWLKSRFPRIDALDFGNLGGVGVIAGLSVTGWNALVPAALRILPGESFVTQALFVTGLGVIGHAGKKIAETKLAKSGRLDRRAGETLGTWISKMVKRGNNDQ